LQKQQVWLYRIKSHDFGGRYAKLKTRMPSAQVEHAYAAAKWKKAFGMPTSDQK
jgi:hypothetical protein